MRKTLRLSLALAAVVILWAAAIPTSAQKQEAPKIEIPKSGVSQIMTMEGKFVRAAYNNEGYVILGYQPANRSVGEEWLLLEIGVTVRDRVPAFKLTRDMLSLETPDGKTLPLPTVTEFRAGNTRALQNRAKVQRDSINYFPHGAPGRAASASSPTWILPRWRTTRSRSATPAPALAASISTCRVASSMASIGST